MSLIDTMGMLYNSDEFDLGGPVQKVTKRILAPDRPTTI